MATRINPALYAVLQSKVRGLRYYELARICAIAPDSIEPQDPGIIGILSAGTADLPVAEEAACHRRTVRFSSAASLGCGSCWNSPLAKQPSCY